MKVFKGRLTLVVLTAFVIIGMMPACGNKVFAASDVQYVERSWNGSKVTETTKTAWCTPVSDVDYDEFHNGWWYYVNSNVEYDDRVEISGTVNLILADGKTLTCNDGINVGSGSTLNIFPGPGGSGKLVAKGDTNDCAAIGGNDGQAGGTIVIHGGNVVADCYNSNAGEDAAGIGGGEGASGATVDIYGGTVNATGGTKDSANSGAGIGSGDKDGYSVNAGTIKIYDGNVTAQGGPDAAGIGGGNEVSGGTVEITGGTVKATGGRWGAGIGGGEKGSGGTVTVKNAVVTATGGEDAMGFGRGKDGGGNGSLNLGENVALFGGNSENPGNRISTSDRYQYMIARYAYPYVIHTSKFCLEDNTGYKMGFRFADIILKKGGKELCRTRFEKPGKANNDFTVEAIGIADTIRIEYYTELSDAWGGVHTVYKSEEHELIESKSLRNSIRYMGISCCMDYRDSNLPAPEYTAPSVRSGLHYTGSAQELINGGSVKTGG